MNKQIYNWNTTILAYGVLDAPISQTYQLKLECISIYNSFEVIQDLNFVYLPNLHKLKCYNFGSWFVGCAYITNLPIKIETASLSIIVLK